MIEKQEGDNVNLIESTDTELKEVFVIDIKKEVIVYMFAKVAPLFRLLMMQSVK